MPTFKLNPIHAAVKTLLLSSLATASVAVSAEQTENQAKKETKAEVIQVRGVRGSVVKSLNTKRYANAIVDVITAEDVGKFPDQNVAESLQRITGVSITRAFGEGERVSIRGTTESQNRTLLNGQAVGSADWWTNQRLIVVLTIPCCPQKLSLG